MSKSALFNPQPSLEGGNLHVSSSVSPPVVNSVDYSDHNISRRAEDGKGLEAPDWIRMARDAFEASDSWLQINQRAAWARSFAHFRSEHAPDSPINCEANKHRSNYFWPKSRTLVRAIQAAAASAYFTSSDVVAIEAEDSDNQDQSEAAELIKQLVNYRLSQTIPWYQLVLGAISEAAVLGTVASHQSWLFREDKVLSGMSVDPETGAVNPEYSYEVLEDEPQVRIVPIENIRISPASDWIDPANSSPYIIELIPMYVGDVLNRVKEGKESKGGEPAWRDIGASRLIGYGDRQDYDSTRQARAGAGRQDPKTNGEESVDLFKTVWIHRNIVRYSGEDWVYYTVGTGILLSDPVRLKTVIPWAKGKRDYVLGKLEIETDRPYPSSVVDLSSNMQRALNDLKNQRYDNVRQVLNRRYLYRQGNQVDVRALMRNIPGGLVGVSAPGPLSSHVEPLPVQDVTSSSYQEEDRISLAMDDLSGSTSGSTVNSNRRLQETATGMNLMSEAANQVREMELRTFTESWMEPVLRQIVQLEAMYETDTTALTVSARKARVLRVLPKYFEYSFSVSVNVGMGAVSPTQRMERIKGAVAAAVQLIPDAAPAIRGDEIVKEIFGAAGFDNGNRFFDFSKVEEMKANPQPDPNQELMQKQLEAKVQADQGKLQVAQSKLELESARLEIERMKMQAKIQEMEAKLNLFAAQTSVQNVTAVYQASQAAAVVAQNPTIAPVSDEILKSSGYIDHNSAPVIPETGAPVESLEPSPVQGNTNPSLPLTPPSPAAGLRSGIETPQAGDSQNV